MGYFSIFINFMIIKILFLIINELKVTYSISCFECSSYNHNNPECEDPFYRSSKILLRKNCLTHVPSRIGEFRASHCIKIVANGYGHNYVLRTCSLDMGTGKIDTELVSVSHCGYLSLNNFYAADLNHNTSNLNEDNNESQNLNKFSLFKGCLAVCNHDECNYSKSNYISNYKFIFLKFFILILSRIF